ncbi:AAA family ATPase [Plantactinospora sp. WMMB334]|uniref:AAA family ATPase n=1 Tax=Plantactinospora sp. WMMB334 TaxID=3404119 RepID=UPI003B92246C
MLRSFRVANHRSIRDEQELSFEPVYDKSGGVLPVAAVFGANASGKSNLLDALSWMRDAVLTSFAGWQPGSGVSRSPFRLDPESATSPSGYCVEVVVGGLRYSYGMEVDDRRVRHEWLYSYPHGRRRVIFERNDVGIRLGSTVPEHRARAESLQRQTRDNALFLTVAALHDLAEVQPLYRWFRNAVGFGPLDATSVAEEDLIQRLRTDDRDRTVALIRAADLGIVDVTVGQADIDLRLTAGLLNELIDRGLIQTTHRKRRFLAGERIDKDVLDQVLSEEFKVSVRDLIESRDPGARPRLMFRHGASAVALGIEDQSAGTRSWLGLASQALRTLDSGGLLVVDEVDASLHPYLTAELVSLFRSTAIETTGAQLLFTTHDATLLDEDVLARDEIWFVEKDAGSGATRLYPLAEFHPRKNENTRGRYLAGSYGAVPVLARGAFRDALSSRRTTDDAA